MGSLVGATIALELMAVVWTVSSFFELFVTFEEVVLSREFPVRSSSVRMRILSARYLGAQTFVIISEKERLTIPSQAAKKVALCVSG